MNISPAPRRVCWRAGIASPSAHSARGGYGGHRLLMHEDLGVLPGDAVGRRNVPVPAGQVSHRRGSRLRYMAGWHSGTQLSPARLPGKQRGHLQRKLQALGTRHTPIPSLHPPAPYGSLNPERRRRQKASQHFRGN